MYYMSERRVIKNTNNTKRTLRVCLGEQKLAEAWLPDGYSQIFRSYVFGPSGFWNMAPLRYTAGFDPFLSLDCARVDGVGGWSNSAIWQPWAEGSGAD